jgi:hypothetical protein
MTSYKPEMLVAGKWSGNALRFATKEEAEQNARDLFSRWTTPEDWRVVESEDAIKHVYIDGELREYRTPVEEKK